METDFAACLCKKSIVGTESYVFTCMNPGAVLTYQNLTGLYKLSAVALDTQTLGIGVSSVL